MILLPDNVLEKSFWQEKIDAYRDNWYEGHVSDIVVDVIKDELKKQAGLWQKSLS